MLNICSCYVKLNFYRYLYLSANFLHNLLCVCLVHNVGDCMKSVFLPMHVAIETVKLSFVRMFMIDCSFYPSLCISVSLSIFLPCWRINGIIIIIIIIVIITITGNVIIIRIGELCSVFSQLQRWQILLAVPYFWISHISSSMMHFLLLGLFHDPSLSDFYNCCRNLTWFNSALKKSRFLLSTHADSQCVGILFTVCLCVCMVMDFSAEDKASDVKFCTAVRQHPRQGTNFCELSSFRSPK